MKLIFTSDFNPRGTNVSQIIHHHFHLIKNSSFLHIILLDGSILVANKGCPNFKTLLVCCDWYNVKHDLTDIVPHDYKPCSKKCDSFDNFVASQSYLISNATEREYYFHWDSTCSKPNVAYMAYCRKCIEQGVGSTISWKPRLHNCKSHIKKKVHSCKIVTHLLMNVVMRKYLLGI